MFEVRVQGQRQRVTESVNSTDETLHKLKLPTVRQYS